MFGQRELLNFGHDLAAFDDRTATDDELSERAVCLERFASLVAAARLHAMVELDAREVTDTEYGLVTPTWLAREAERSGAHVRRDLKVAKRLRERLTDVDAALIGGEISIDHARVISEACNARNIDGMALLQREMIDASKGVVFEHWRSDIARLADLLDDDGPYDPNADLARNRLHLADDLDGLGHLKVVLTPELYAAAKQTIDDRAKQIGRRYRELHKLDPDVAVPPLATLRALALSELLHESLAVDLDGTAEPRVELSLILRSFGIGDTDRNERDDHDDHHDDADGGAEHAERPDREDQPDHADRPDGAATPAATEGGNGRDDGAHAEGPRDDHDDGARGGDDDDLDVGDGESGGDEWWDGAWADWDGRDEAGDDEDGGADGDDPGEDDHNVVFPTGFGSRSPKRRGESGSAGACCARHRGWTPMHDHDSHDDPGWLLRQAMRAAGQHAGAAAFDRDGTTVPDALLHYLLCDPDMYAIVVNSLGVPVDMGRKIRLANRAQRRAMAARDGGCVMPGCGRPVHWTHAHHTDVYEFGGFTDVRLMASLCATCHGVVHRYGWSMHLADDGWFWFQTPSSRTFWAQRRYKRRSDPPPAAVLTATATASA